MVVPIVKTVFGPNKIQLNCSRKCDIQFVSVHRSPPHMFPIFSDYSRHYKPSHFQFKIEQRISYVSTRGSCRTTSNTPLSSVPQTTRMSNGLKGVCKRE